MGSIGSTGSILELDSIKYKALVNVAHWPCVPTIISSL